MLDVDKKIIERQSIQVLVEGIGKDEKDSVYLAFDGTEILSSFERALKG